MGLSKDGHSFSTKAGDSNANSLETLFAANNFSTFFQVARAMLSYSYKERLEPFYTILTEENLIRINNEHSMARFLESLKEFLDSSEFNEQMKVSFFNECETLCLNYAIELGKYDIAKRINQFRKDKGIRLSFAFLSKLAELDQYEAMDQLFLLCDNFTYNGNEFLKVMLEGGCVDYPYMKNLITKYKLDINGMGDFYYEGESFNEDDEYSFAQLVCQSYGTMWVTFMEAFIADFANQIDFDVKSYNDETAQRYNVLELIFNSSVLDPHDIIRNTNLILKNCNLTEKHIGFIAYRLLDSGYSASYYDHEIYESLFSHKNFNSHLFDREAFLNALLELDNGYAFNIKRSESSNTVNPTSVLLDKFFKYANPIVNVNTHPFVTWIKAQRKEYSKDTLRTLFKYYGEELESLQLHKVEMSPQIKEELKKHGIVFQNNPGFMSFLSKIMGKDKEKKSTKSENIVKPEPSVQNIVVVRAAINTSIIEQVKNEQIKKLIDSIILNHEQYGTLERSAVMTEKSHYMNTLLPKLLNQSIEIYLHFLTLDEKMATDNVIAQLKLLNMKSFEALHEEVGQRQKELEYKSAVHNKVIENHSR